EARSRGRLGQMTCTHFASRVERWGEKIGRPNEKGGQGSDVWTKTGAVTSGDSMTANHVEHGIATFPGSPGRGGRRRRAVKREAEEDWARGVVGRGRSSALGTNGTSRI